MQALLFLLILLTLGCQKPVKQTPLPQQHLRINIPADPVTFDPRKGGDPIASMIHFLLYDGLTRLKADGQVELALADTVNVSEDGKTYTFTLRQAYWSNGDRVTSIDFERSWKAILDPAFPAANAQLLYPIARAEEAKKGLVPLSEVGIHTPDEMTLVVQLQEPTPYFLELISFCVFFPVNASLEPQWENSVEKSLICSGPFLLKQWARQNQIILVKNPDFHRAEQIQLEEIHISMVASETTALQMYQKGDLDILGHPLMPLPTEAIPELQTSGELHIRPVGATTFCSFNVSRFPFSNVKIRKAFAYAINRAEIVQNITQLAEEPALGIIPPSVKKGGRFAFFQDADGERARALFQEGLAELGITEQEFPLLTYYYQTAEVHHKVAQALQQQWEKVLGVKIELQSTPHKLLMDLLKTRDYTFAQSCWMVQYNDPMNILERFKIVQNVKNYPGWENLAFIDCLNRSNRAKDPEERLAIIEEAEQVMLEEMPLAPIFHWSSAFLAKDHVKMFNLAPIGNGYFEQVCIAPKE
jgi:oligopeptide transport system substrate-binding protein